MRSNPNLDVVLPQLEEDGWRAHVGECGRLIDYIGQRGRGLKKQADGEYSSRRHVASHDKRGCATFANDDSNGHLTKLRKAGQ